MKFSILPWYGYHSTKEVVMSELNRLSDSEIDRRIHEIKAALGETLFIPVHHYQRDEIVQFADYTGDSLELSRVSAATSARYIVFCGVYFMAEIARILATKEKHVLIPNRSAGCPLADFALQKDVQFVWEMLQEQHPDGYIPVSYANSHADVKAFCGKHGGLVCTSSNVQKVFERVLEEGKRVFFMPDRNLGINTAVSLELENKSSVVNRFDHGQMNVRDTRIIVWNGFCSVHTVFRVDQVLNWRKRIENVRVIVHPECDPEVVKASDESGSTSKIKRTVEDSPEGSAWVIGTELNFVRRLKRDNPEKVVEPLDQSVCEDMSKIRRHDLLATLMQVADDRLDQQVTLADDVIRDARKAIDRMLHIS
jgi:quinolinate synthase